MINIRGNQPLWGNTLNIDERFDKLTSTIELQNRLANERMDREHDEFRERHRLVMEQHEAAMKRIDRMEERHEALAQSVELMHMDTMQLQVLVREVTGGIRDLVTVLRSHGQRLDDLEGTA